MFAVRWYSDASDAIFLIVDCGLFLTTSLITTAILRISWCRGVCFFDVIEVCVHVQCLEQIITINVASKKRNNYRNNILIQIISEFILKKSQDQNICISFLSWQFVIMKKVEKIAWIRSHDLHLQLQRKFKLFEANFTWVNKAKHCWVGDVNKLQWFAFTPQARFLAHNLNFHWRRRWWDRIQA